jgi:hypothetical protein
LSYEGRPHTLDHGMYRGTGEDEGWRFWFNGPNGHFVAWVKTERDAVRGVCVAAKGRAGRLTRV